jgi:hypothetical protein
MKSSAILLGKNLRAKKIPAEKKPQETYRIVVIAIIPMI